MYFAIQQKVIKPHFAALKAAKVFSSPDAGFGNSDMSRRGGFNLICFSAAGVHQAHAHLHLHLRRVLAFGQVPPHG